MAPGHDRQLHRRAMRTIEPGVVLPAAQLTNKAVEAAAQSARAGKVKTAGAAKKLLRPSMKVSIRLVGTTSTGNPGGRNRPVLPRGAA